MTDDDLAAILFLDAHPGWSWADLMGAPEHIVAGLLSLDREKARHARGQ